MPMLTTAVREAKLELLTLPNVLKGSRRVSPATAAEVARLRESGYTPFGKAFSAADVAAIRAHVDDLIERNQTDWNKSGEYWEIHEPLTIPRMLDLATHERLLDIVNHYFGRECLLADADLRRIPPREMSEIEKHGKTSSNWHRDTRGRQIKLMVYLTDVGEHDSNFAFYPRSHRQREYSFEGSRFNDEQAAQFGTPIEWHGAAGDGMLFDTNIVHRLRRKSTGTVRDSVTFYFTPGQFLRRLSTTGLRLTERQQRLIHGAPWWSKRV